jgi:hypothetical protein
MFDPPYEPAAAVDWAAFSRPLEATEECLSFDEPCRLRLPRSAVLLAVASSIVRRKGGEERENDWGGTAQKILVRLLLGVEAILSHQPLSSSVTLFRSTEQVFPAYTNSDNLSPLQLIYFLILKRLLRVEKANRMGRTASHPE